MLAAVVREAARRFGDAPAIVAPDGRPLSYRDLDVASDDVARGLSARGVGEGSVVGLIVPTSAEYVVAYAAAAKLGAVTGGVNTRLSAHEREKVLDALQPDVVLSSAAEVNALRTGGDPLTVLPPDPERAVAVVFTSGTTGAPKGAEFREKQLEAIARLDTGSRWGGGSPMLASTELVHVGFMTKLPWYLMLGGPIHMLAKWRAADALRTIAEQRIPSVGGIGAQIALMLRLPDFDDHDLSHVTSIIAGGARSSPELIVEARERFGAPFSVRYSSTESGGLGTLTAFDAPDEESLHTVGRPRPGIELEIRDGEVCLRSPAQMSGYWRDPAATAETIIDGWLHTGDLGEIDDRGCLRLLGRAKEMFIRGGYNVYPVEVEAVLSEHPGVAEVAVVPRPEPVMGEIGVAVVVPRGHPPSLEELRAFGGDRLAAYKLPEAIRVVEALPLTSLQKVDRRALEAAERDAT